MQVYEVCVISLEITLVRVFHLGGMRFEVETCPCPAYTVL